MTRIVPDFDAFDDVLAENNRLIMQSGGPKPPTKEQMAETAAYIADYKKKHRKEIDAVLAEINLK